MKAKKGCVNRNCKAYTKKIIYKDEFDYCPLCSEKLEYVCADCWKVLEHDTYRYCEACKVKREQKREKTIEKVKAYGPAVVGALGAAWKKKDKIIEVANKIINK